MRYLFAVVSLITGFICLAAAKPAHPGAFTVLGAVGTVLLAVGLLTFLIPLFALIFRFVGRGIADIRDNIRIVRRGVLNPIQLRQEFIDTMGREPTIAEVNDLSQLIKTEYDQAVQRLIIIAAVFIGSTWFFHRHPHHTSPATPLSNVTSLQGRR